jgi:outer membrane protein assembly factor BamB
MYGRDHTHNGVSPEIAPAISWNIGTYDEKTAKWTGADNIRWVAALGSQTFGDPVVADGQVWVGTNLAVDGKPDASVLAAFSASNGKPLYQYISLRLPQGRGYDWPYSAMACSPLIEGDRMWFMTNRCETVCIDLAPLKRGEAKPREVWKVDMMKQFGVKPFGSRMTLCHICSVASYKDLIFVITDNGVDMDYDKVPAPQAPSVVCFKKDNGKVVWQDNSPGANILEGQCASPSVVEINNRAQVIAPLGDGWLRSFDAATGHLIWKFDINSKTAKWQRFGGRNTVRTRNSIMATPISYNGRVYVASGRYAEFGEGPGRLICIDLTKTGDISSELALDAAGQTIPYNRAEAVDAAKGQLAVPNPNSGLVWEYTEWDRNGNGKIEYGEQFHRTYGNAAIKDNLLVIGDWCGVVHCLDATTGKVHWEYDSLASIYGSPLIVGEKVYIANEDGNVLIFRLSPEPQKPLATIEMDTVVYTSPIFANGTLYIASRNNLFAIGGDQAAQRDAAATTPDLEHHERTPRSAFVPTPQDVVEKMLDLAKLKAADRLYDLGSGDGRIVVTAAKKYGCRAVGYELDKELIEASRSKAKAENVGALATFERQDLFTAELGDADVVALYLIPKQLERLVPQLNKLKPGARIVSHEFEIPGIKPNKAIKFKSADDGEEHAIFLWAAPIGK